MTRISYLALAVTLVSTACLNEPVSSGVEIAPYSAVTLDGQPFRLPDSSGRVLLINVWATWCGPCRREVPELKMLKEKYAPRKFDVVGISVDTSNDEDEVRRFVKNQGINYPIVLDPEGRMTIILNSVVLPTSALVDRSGKIVWVKVGIVDPDDPGLRRALNQAL